MSRSAANIAILLMAFCAISAGWAPGAAAIEVQGLFQAEVEVASRDDLNERRRGFEQALQKVLIKASGREDVMDIPLLRVALISPEDYVDSWSYRSVAAGETGAGGDAVQGAGEGVALQVAFFEPEVLRLLDSAGLPVWPSNRPDTLVWVVVQDELGEREIVGSGAGNYGDVMASLGAYADDRGLPLLMPLLDFEDQIAISAAQLWALDRAALQTASARYQTDSVLAIRLFRSLGGEVVGRSLHLFRGIERRHEAVEASQDAFLKDSVALAARELSGHYAFQVSGTGGDALVNLTVEGVNSLADYANLLRYVGELADVKTYRVLSAAQRTIELELATGGQLRQLVESMALTEELTPLAPLTRDEDRFYLSYQWRGRR